MEENRFPGGTGLSSTGSSVMVMNNNSGVSGKLGSIGATLDANNQQIGGGQLQVGALGKMSQYSMAGILQFLQTEWAKFEVQRANWEMERAELQARIAFLDGERRAQENLKRDLVRRIKMLEYALKQERAKYHKMRYGVDLESTQSQANRKGDADQQNQTNSNNQRSANSENGPLANIKQARQLLRAYLREVGYTDTILDVRNVRVRQLLGIQQPAGDDRTGNGRSSNAAGADARVPQNVRGKSNARGILDDVDMSHTSVNNPNSGREAVSGNMADDTASDDEGAIERGDDDALSTLVRARRELFEGSNDASYGVDDIIGGDAEEQEVLAEFDYLVNDAEATQPLDSLKSAGNNDDSTTLSSETGAAADGWRVNQSMLQSLKDAYVKDRKGKLRAGAVGMFVNLGGGESVIDNMDYRDNHSGNVEYTNNDTELDMTDLRADGPIELGRGTSAFRAPAAGARSTHDAAFDREQHGTSGPAAADRSDEPIPGDRQLGELAELNMVPGSGEDYTGLGDLVGGGALRRAETKTWAVKYTLRSHFDGVRALAFHPFDAALLTASEDHTLKFWSLHRTVQSKKTGAFDVEPIYTFRAHTKPVLCVALNQAGTHAYSAGLDSTIRIWNLPSASIDQYDPYDPSVFGDSLTGHSDAVWSLVVHPTQPQLLSASADGSVRLWSVGSHSSLINTYRLFADDIPTSVCFQQTDTSQCLVTTSRGDCYAVDLERGVVVCRFEATADDAELAGGQRAASGGRYAYRVVSQSTNAACVCAYEDRTIRFFDTHTGRQTHAMVAHLDAVTSLAIDPSGLYLLSGSHDSSVRIWTLESRTCVQEITAHRKKFAESIHDVAFHPQKPLFASAGADALAKVFTA